MTSSSKERIADLYQLFHFGKTGIGALASPQMHDVVFDRLRDLDTRPLTKVQLNQLLVLSGAGSVSDGFFRYYWRSCPNHTYVVRNLPFFAEAAIGNDGQEEILSHDHLRWGLYRLYVDGLLYFGSVSAAFSGLRSMKFDDLQSFFEQKRFDTAAISQRGPAIPLAKIGKDDRYLISEMVCKTFGELPADKEQARSLLLGGLKDQEGKALSFRQLLERVAQPGTKDQFLLSFDDVLDNDVSSEQDLNAQFDRQFEKFRHARAMATQNTELYLSMVNDLDVYVATSMRNRKNFRDIANACEQIFGDSRLEKFHLRYFDPTMSAAQGHEDKGLIECLMVKCAKVLIYSEGEKESYGKDAEAAMALSLGKPVIFYCDHGVKTRFYRDVHPLSRLIDFRSGVAVGAIVSDRAEEVAELLRRIFANEMEYELRHHENRPGYLKLHERLTDSVVRLQTDDGLLTSAFWNNYHNRQLRNYVTLAAGKEVERLQ